MEKTSETAQGIGSLSLTKEDVLHDYRIVCESRETSLMGRREVFMGKAKFGIFGDGKELAQVAMARVFKKGDFRSGYYRDQTITFALEEVTIQQFFAQLYAHTDLEHEPSTGGRSMNSHFASRSVELDGTWRNLTEQYNAGADLSPTAGQIPRSVGLALASKLYRKNPALHSHTQFSNQGNEICFGTIGNASCAEGVFLEAMNAAGVQQIPLIMSVWDDEYGISVPNEYQMIKSSISKTLEGMRKEEGTNGIGIIEVKGWKYWDLIEAYATAERDCRATHTPYLIHVNEITQPQGHSTSGSHERYKSKERLEWEMEHDCLPQFRKMILEEGFADEETLKKIEKEAKDKVKRAKNAAWKAFTKSLEVELKDTVKAIEQVANHTSRKPMLMSIKRGLEKTLNPIRLDMVKAVKKSLIEVRHEPKGIKAPLLNWLEKYAEKHNDYYHTHLYDEGPKSALKVEVIPPKYADQPKIVDGREVVQACFDDMFKRDPRVIAFGEDLGKIGDVNQGFAGLQEKHGEIRIFDTGIREPSIIGQGTGTAMRGLRPIAEIQYLDYVFYALMTMTDDLACLQYRTKGGQKAPVLIRTRGHRLEGIWHSGSPMSALLGSIRGIYILTPRNMTQAAGMYNTMLKSDDAALMIESLNGYRLKEKLPQNIGEFTVPIGITETLQEGTDVTLVTYGSMCRIVQEASLELEKVGISCEIIDVQTLTPFDREHSILDSIKKTNRVVFLDEDVSGGATAYMMQKVLDEQGAYEWLDSKPVCVSAKDHRPAYASDGDYFSKPNIEQVFDTVYQLMSEVNPSKYPSLY